MKPIFQFEDHRAFLKAYYLEKKQHQPSFSYRVFSAACGFKSPTYIWHVIEGKKNLTLDAIFNVAHAMNLSDVETDHFEALVHLSQSNSEAAKKHLNRRLKVGQFDSKPNEERVISRTPQSSLFSDVMMPAFLMCIAEKEFKKATQDLMATFILNQEEAENLFESFRKRGLVSLNREDPNAKASVNWQTLTAHASSNELSGKRFLHNQIHLSQLSFADQFEKGGKYYSTVLSVPERELAECQKRIQALLSELSQSSAWSEDNRLFQLNLQLFKYNSQLHTKVIETFGSSKSK